MSNSKRQIKWRVCGENGWNRKGEYLGVYDLEIRYVHGKGHTEIVFYPHHHGQYGVTDEELARAKADAERLMPGWVEQRRVEAEARKVADAQKAEANRVHQARLESVLASLKALGIVAHDNFGSVGLELGSAEALVARLSAHTATEVES